jgi:hypothetical protein
MNAFDIAIYGHLSFDNIYEGFNYKSSVGCMGNVWNHLKYINSDLKIKLEPTDIGESLIIVDVEHNKRASISRLSLKTNKPTIHSATINHIMYLNELSDCSFIKDIKGYIVADTCNGKTLQLDSNVLKDIDLLLISEEDLTEKISDIVSLVRGHVLVHYPAGSTLYCKNSRQARFEAEFVPNINVLGAGDKLVSYILAGLDNTRGIDKVIQQAHNSLTDYFKNEKI